MWFKKVFILGVLGISVAANLAPTPHVAAHQGLSSAPIVTPRVIRFRVIANSDNPLDQAIKLDVRDAVLRQLEPLLAHAKDRAEAARLIRQDGPRLNRAANGVLRAHNVSYRAHIDWTRTTFPTKAYGSWVLPAGQYRALLVVLGRGQGHNWWCVLFPSLCFIDMDNALAVPVTSTPRSTPGPMGAPSPVGPRPSASPSRASASPTVSHRAPHSHHRVGAIRVSWRAPTFMRTLMEILR